MVRRALAILLAAAGICLSVTSCGGAFLPVARDIAEVKLMRTVALDSGEDGGVKVTACGDVQKESAGGQTKKPIILSRQALTVYGGFSGLQDESDGYVEFGHLAECVIGEDYARSGVEGFTDYLERDISLRMETKLFVVVGGAGWEAIRGAASDSSALTDRLTAVSKDRRLGGRRWPYTLREYINDQEDNGVSLLPALTLSDNPELQAEGGDGVPKKTVDCTGLVWFRDQRLEGVLTEEESRGVSILSGNDRLDRFEVPLEGGVIAGVQLTDARCTLEPSFAPDGRLEKITARVRVSGDLSELSAWADPQDEATLGAIEDGFCRQVQSACQAALDRSEASGADFLHLRRKLVCQCPLHAKALTEQWETWFPQVELRAEAEGTLRRSYDIGRPVQEGEEWTKTESR